MKRVKDIKKRWCADGNSYMMDNGQCGRNAHSPNRHGPHLWIRQLHLENTSSIVATALRLRHYTVRQPGLAWVSLTAYVSDTGRSGCSVLVSAAKLPLETTEQRLRRHVADRRTPWDEKRPFRAFDWLSNGAFLKNGRVRDITFQLQT